MQEKDSLENAPQGSQALLLAFGSQLLSTGQRGRIQADISSRCFDPLWSQSSFPGQFPGSRVGFRAGLILSLWPLPICGLTMFLPGTVLGDISSPSPAGFPQLDTLVPRGANPGVVNLWDSPRSLAQEASILKRAGQEVSLEEGVG